MPLPSWAGVLGMLRTTAGGAATFASAAVVAPARMLMTSWPSSQVRRQLAADAREHLGLDAQHDDVGVGDGASLLDSTARMPWSRAQMLPPLGAGVAGDDLLRRHLAALSRPAIIASAITPVPMVAMVRSVSGIGSGV